MRILKDEENVLEEKIRNCEIVENSTTVQEYYLWQKKQIMEDHESRLALLTGEIKDEKDKLN